jgi:hypothetical protein
MGEHWTNLVTLMSDRHDGATSPQKSAASDHRAAADVDMLADAVERHRMTWDRCYDFKKISEKFSEKIGIFDSKQS